MPSTVVDVPLGRDVKDTIAGSTRGHGGMQGGRGGGRLFVGSTELRSIVMSWMCVLVVCMDAVVPVMGRCVYF